MAVKIRLARVGKKHVPFYRIVAIDSRRKRDGEALEVLGSYDPVNQKIIQFYDERVAYWLSQGAVPTDAFKKIQKLQVKAKTAAA